MKLFRIPNQIKNPLDTISPLNWLVISAGMLPALYVIFKPSPWMFALVLGVDYLMVPVFLFLDRYLFCWFYPQFRLFFPSVRWEQLERLSDSERAGLITDFFRFPSTRAIYVTLLSFAKVVPADLLIIFCWPREGGYWLQASKIVLFNLAALAYFYAAAFMDGHVWASRTIREIHQRFDFSRAFKLVTIGQAPTEFVYQELLSTLFLTAFGMALQAVLIFNHASRSPAMIVLEISTVGLGIMLQVSRIRFMIRSFYVSGFASIADAFFGYDPAFRPGSLPLHTSKVLARFEVVFNTLSEKMQAYERNLSGWMLRKADQSRYLAMGEISALIVHDLSAPLHVIRYCSRELAEHPERISDPRLLKQLSANGERAAELIQSLREYLKAPAGIQGVCTFSRVYSHCIRLLETRYYSVGYARIRLTCDPALMDMHLDILEADLVHILFNVISNSVENLLQNNIDDPSISLSLSSVREGVCEITLSDNGTGLTPERFEELTGTLIREDSGQQGYGGLGLRLVRRLVERSQGTLRVLQKPLNPTGTTFCLCLPIASGDPAVST